LQTINLPPLAEALMESMRDVGYTIEAAMADLIDNCISAKAREIDIHFSSHESPYVAVVDDGEGMSPDDLTRAMCPGSRSPREEREATDLGRFGLGMKTASLSQCRRLTVISRQDGVTSGREWDLDYLNQVKDWKLKVLAAADIQSLPAIDQLPERGTMILWRVLDRLEGIHGTGGLETGMDAVMARVQHHLELVFHRFLSGEPGLQKVRIRINGHPLMGADPFGLQFPATQLLNREVVNLAGAEIVIQPYVLPHHSKISADAYNALGGEDGHLRSQGFYIYRNRRLIISGTWFRLVRQSELTKLARVQVDIPNTLDHLWTLDVKKSFAAPPELVRKELKRVINQITGRSERVYTHKGARTMQDGNVHVWERAVKNGRIRYVLNREHPLLKGLVEDLDDVDATELLDVFSMVESTLPMDYIYADVGANYAVINQDEDEDALVQERLVDAYVQLLRSAEVRESDIRSRLLTVEPFCRNKAAVQVLLDKWGIQK
jgi:hypothetical protein